MKDIVVLIPSLEPKEEFIDFVKKLRKDFANIIVVNDGSSKKYNDIFEKIEQYATVLKHNKNKGKGRALKTGFEYIKDNYHNVVGIITADSDGQHSIEDIIKCANKLKKHKNRLILGIRNFSLPSIPSRNKFGNKLTRYILYNYTGVDIGDTQTGLRGYGLTNIDKYLSIPGERFEYEMNTLIMLKELNIEIMEVHINTIYSRVDYSSHFDPIKDSLKVYKLFTKYILSSFGSFILELVLFFIFLKMIPNMSLLFVFYITILSKLIPQIVRYFINKKVLSNNYKTMFSFSKYFNFLFLSVVLSSLNTYLVINSPLLWLFKIFIEIILVVIITFLRNKIQFKNR